MTAELLRVQRTSEPDRLARLRQARQAAIRGELAATERQHTSGKLTARERLDRLLDPASFTELDMFRRSQAAGPFAKDEPWTDGVVTGSGTVYGRRVFAYAQDFRIFGGSLGETHAAKIHKVMDLAIAAGAPLIALADSGGARIQEGVTALAGYGGIFLRNVRASGVIPQISVIMGPCAGGAAYSPALTDFVFMVRDTSHMFITGPDVVQAVTGESVSQAELGGAGVHASTSGVATFVHEDEQSCLDDVRYLLSLLPPNNHELPPACETADPPDRACPRLADLVPADPKKPYDIREVISEITDFGEFMELHEGWAPNIVCALGRLGGRTVGVVANQPLVLAGVLDIRASEKAARFIQFCDAFNIPLVSLVDVPGFLPGLAQEHGGIIRHGAKLLFAYCAATVPRVQVILRKAYGGAYIVMDSRSVGADLSFAWPGNEIAVMGAEAAVGVLHRRDLAAASDPGRLRAQLAAAYKERLMHPYYAAERGLVDDVIDPRETRTMLVRALDLLSGKRRPEAVPRKHGNQPV
ncbi:MAG TPA: acyl-CoA carboxylase subunit beta [Streptosporangiaceae bacterium]|nr:acyl-CoA carboxylase subunit beta [Streptosporangiaceae bacterium]